MKKACDDAITAARYVGSFIPEDEKVRLAKVVPANDEVSLGIKRGAKDVGLDQKIKLMGDYAAILAKADSRIVNSTVRYADFYVKKYFANSDGAFIVSEGSDMNGNFSATALEGRKACGGLRGDRDDA
ncbi:MAG: hypothetical protein MZV49_05190 [Rhodopseudomonas palustris]|nr:hypothetical protein [Rhodopseudomonas palustris]